MRAPGAFVLSSPWMRARLFAPSDLAPLIWLRIVFGAVLVVEMIRFAAHGWIRSYYVEPSFHFRYFGFSWVPHWPGEWMYLHFVLTGVAAALVTVGLFYRFAAPALFVGITYVFLLDQTHYLNHLYLVCLLACLLVLLPGGSAWALDARLGLTPQRSSAPTWMLWLMRAQIGLVYFFGGIAKLDRDWLSGVPGAMFLDNHELTAPLAEREWAAKAFAYGGAGFDLLIVPALLHRRTRPFAVVAAILFHVSNDRLFSIGIFPWLMIAATPIFFEPKTVRRMLSLVAPPPPEVAPSPPRWPKAVVGFLAVWMAVQVALPLRHWLYPGEVNWTEEGHTFAWHMKLRNKRADAKFFLRYPDGRQREVDPRELLTRRQYRKMSTRPDLILQFAHELARREAANGQPGVEVRARVRASLNGRRKTLLVDPSVDLSRQPWSLRPSPWIVPFDGQPVTLSTRVY